MNSGLWGRSTVDGEIDHLFGLGSRNKSVQF